MSNTTFTTGTLIASSWLNDVNSSTYGGTAGKVLTSTGSGNVATWQTPATPTVVFFPQTLITTAAGTTTLTNSSTYEQIFQGSTTQTCVLPVVSTLSLGPAFWIKNESTGIVTVNSSGGNLVVTLNSGDCALVTCILITGTTAASWDLQINAQRGGDSTQVFNVAPATAAGHAVQAGQTMGKNKIINGDFKVNQKAFTSPQTLVTGVPSTGAGYGHDMWRGGASGCTYSFTNANLGLSSVVTITAGSLITAVESVNIDATTYVLSWTGTAVARIGVNGAAPSGNFAVSPIYITTAVIGTQTSIEFAMSGSVGGSSIVNTGTGTLSLVQIEEGVYKTTFERKLYDQVLRECQRYLPSFYGVMTLGSGYAPAGNTGWIYVKLPVTTRVPVTGILVSALTDIFIEYDSTAVVVSALALGTYSGTDGVQLNMTSATSPITLGRGVIGQIQSGVGRVTFTGAQI